MNPAFDRAANAVARRERDDWPIRSAACARLIDVMDNEPFSLHPNAARAEYAVSGMGHQHAPQRPLDDVTIANLKERGIQFVQVRDRDAIHMPADADEYEDRLLDIMLRIPDGWGRWIHVKRGWYSLICELDQSLAGVFPDYVLRQVKQKFGSLHYNWEPPSDVRPFSDPDDPRPSDTNEDVGELQLASWERRQVDYRERIGLTDEFEDVQQRLARANTLVSRAEQRSQHTCEFCGGVGSASQSDEPQPRILILCDGCRPLAGDETDYLTVRHWRQKYDTDESHQLSAQLRALAEKRAAG